MSTKKKKPLTIAQRAGYIRRKLKREEVTKLKDYKGQEVPIDYIPDIELVEHFQTIEFIDEALDLRRRLQEFKFRLQTTGDDIYRQILDDNGVEMAEIKNFTLSSFNKERKIVYKRPPKYTKDEKELEISRQYKRKFLDDTAGGAESWLVDLLEELIEDSRGDVDMGKISKLNKLAQKIPNKNFKLMVKHFNQCLDAYYAKRYEQFLLRDDQGEEQSIILTYANVKPQDPSAGEADSE